MISYYVLDIAYSSSCYRYHRKLHNLYSKHYIIGRFIYRNLPKLAETERN